MKKNKAEYLTSLCFITKDSKIFLYREEAEEHVKKLRNEE